MVTESQDQYPRGEGAGRQGQHRGSGLMVNSGPGWEAAMETENQDQYPRGEEAGRQGQPHAEAGDRQDQPHAEVEDRQAQQVRGLKESWDPGWEATQMSAFSIHNSHVYLVGSDSIPAMDCQGEDPRGEVAGRPAQLRNEKLAGADS
jgi:hypothetical protein